MPTLAEISPRNLGRTQNRALMRLLLRVQGETHRLLRAFYDDAVTVINNTVDAEGLVDGVAMVQRIPALEVGFRAVMAEWKALFEKAREQAASIPFGGLVIAHNYYFKRFDESALRQAQGKLEERIIDSRDVDAVVRLWQGRRDRALNAGAQRIEGDGLQLSQRIWRLENDGLQRIRSTLSLALAERTSARELAKLLESVLGAGQGCPRWSMTRLYGMTTAERTTSKKGLFSGNECSGQGVAYNALRLARTELQYAHHANTMDIYQNAPWVEGYNVRLSPSHPRSDICDDLAASGPYEATNLVIPAHPNCVTPGQQVQIERGNVPIEQVHEGDRVLTHLGRYRKVVRAWSRECNEAVYTITTDKGHFELTGEHPVLLRDRGWVEAKSVQVGDQVLYTFVGAILDSQLVKPENMPALLSEPSIPTGVMLGVEGMPPTSIALNADLDGGQNEIDIVAANPTLPFVGNTGIVKRFHHGDFECRGVGEPVFPLGFQHGQQAGIAFLLSTRDLIANTGSFCGVIVARKVKALHSFLHILADKLTTRAVIFFPTGSNRITAFAHGDIALFQQSSQHSIGETILTENFSAAKALFHIDVLQKLTNWIPRLGFETNHMPLGDSQSVRSAMLMGDTPKLNTTNGANDHDNLLLLSPDSGWGAGSGNPVVSGVMTSAQALTEYTTIRGIEQRNYNGLVYNMEVEGDNSYTVNGAAVHNCLCFPEAAVMPIDDFRKRVRGWLAGDNAFLDQYREWSGFDPTAQLPWSLSLADSLELWLNQNADGHAEALAL